jgi:hypothetical protein
MHGVEPGQVIDAISQRISSSDLSLLAGQVPDDQKYYYFALPKQLASVDGLSPVEKIASVSDIHVYWWPEDCDPLFPVAGGLWPLASPLREPMPLPSLPKNTLGTTGISVKSQSKVYIRRHLKKQTAIPTVKK